MPREKPRGLEQGLPDTCHVPPARSWGLMPTAAGAWRCGGFSGPHGGSLGTKNKQLFLCCTRRPFRSEEASYAP